MYRLLCRPAWEAFLLFQEVFGLTRLGETLRAYQARDPAARSRLEIFLLYPGVHALIYHRIWPHFLYRHRLFFLARLVSQWSRCWTGIEIHPGAQQKAIKTRAQLRGQQNRGRLRLARRAS